MTFTKDDLATAQQFATTFSSPSGQAVLRELDRLYFTTNLFVDGDSDATLVNVGSHRVIAAIYQLIALAHDPRVIGATIIPTEGDTHG